MKLIPFSRYKIVGHSMEPLYKEGQVVWVFHWAYIFSKSKVNDLVVFTWKGKVIFKRVDQVNQSSVSVAGDNKQDSLDSRELGQISFKQITGKVIN